MKKENLTPLLTPGKLLRLNQFIPDILPISRSKWWQGVKDHKYPAPLKLGPRVTVWRSEDIINLVECGLVNASSDQA